MYQRITLIAAVGVLALAGCSGPEGDRGPAGSDGTNGLDGTNGIDGTNGTPGTDGTNGANGAGYVALEASGVVGQVTAPDGSAVTYGTVYFVPAADVAALGATTIAASSTTDEPLEDVIAQSGSAYTQANVGTDGVYRVTTLPAGSYFVTWMPGVSPSDHLPGGSTCRDAMSSTSLVGSRLDVQVSAAIPADATYVGSSKCISCHGRNHIAATMHRLGIWSAYEHGPLQNLEARQADLYQAIDTKFDVGVTVYFYDYDAARGFDKYKTAESNPGANVSFTVTVQRNGSTQALEMVLHNALNAGDPDRIYPVDAIYGGGVNKQRYMTRITNASGFYYAMLPLQFQNAGVEAAPYGRTSKVWRDYNGYKWFTEAAAASAFKEPLPKDSFEKNCVSCHAVGVQVAGSDATTWTATTVEDFLYGDFDYDGNGVAEEMNVGCESCHGPGSRHWESAGQGKHIVSLSLLTPEREAMVCGQCHSRPKGALGTDSPVNSAGMMMIAGTKRSEFLTSYATTQLDGAASDFYADPDMHSKSHHQQYSDFIRSGLYKNATQLVTCATCHDPHRKAANARQLRADPTDNAALCGVCHESQSSNLSAHLTAQSMPTAHDGEAACVDCHMPKTAKTGAGEPGAVLQAVQYWTNDVTSHLFKVPDRSLATSQSMPVPYTNACGACHSAAP